MLYVAMLGADKTTVSVATGNQEFHPLYISAGNATNEIRRAHGDAVVPLAFLAIPKSMFLAFSSLCVYHRCIIYCYPASREHSNSEAFRIFKKQLYHAALTHILLPLQPYMTTPHVIRCPDGHYRQAIFQLGPFIADYPEQVFLAGIVQGWCPK